MSIIYFWILPLLCIKKKNSDTGDIWRSIGGSWSARPDSGYIFCSVLFLMTNILLTVDSGRSVLCSCLLFWCIVWLPLQISHPLAFRLYVPGWKASPTLENAHSIRRKKERNYHLEVIFYSWDCSFCLVLLLLKNLTLCWPHIQGDLPLWSCLPFWCIVLLPLQTSLQTSNPRAFGL